MHLIGGWRRLAGDQTIGSADFSFFELRTSDKATVVEDHRRKLVYEGIIHGVSDNDLLKEPGLLDRAFGYYTYVLYEKGSSAVYIGTDRLGYSPIYFSQTDGCLWFSSSLTLLKYRLEVVTPDMDAWEEKLMIGDILGEKTVIREIKRLHWGRKFRLTRERIDILDVWNPEIPRYASKSTYIRRNNELLIEALTLTQSCPRPKYVLLSGGQDSRRLAITARHASIEFACATQEAIGKNNADQDTLIAKAVSQSLDVPLHRFPISDARSILNDSMIENYWLGYEAGQHAWVFPLMRGLPQHGLIYDGIIADVTVNGHYFRAYPQLITGYRDLDQAARLICGTRQSWVDSERISAPLFERVRSELAFYPESPHRLTYFFLLNHTRRSIGSWFSLYYLFNHQPCLPYMYYPFVEQSLSLEPHHYLEAWMQYECMKEINSTVANIPSTRSGLPADLITPLEEEVCSRARFASRNFRIRHDATEYLPGLTHMQRRYQTMAGLGLRPLAGRWGWAMEALTRFSTFLDWIDDRQGPDFPVNGEISPFIKDHLR